MTSSSNESRCA